MYQVLYKNAPQAKPSIGRLGPGSEEIMHFQETIPVLIALYQRA